jgi:hypothetical protein
LLEMVRCEGGCQRRKRGLGVGKARGRRCWQRRCGACGGGSRRRSRTIIMQHACVGEASAASHPKPQFGSNDTAAECKTRGCNNTDKGLPFELFMNIAACFQFQTKTSSPP